MIEDKKENTDLLSGEKLEDKILPADIDEKDAATKSPGEGTKAVAKVLTQPPVDVMPKNMEGLWRLADGLSRSSILPDTITDQGRADLTVIKANVFWVIQCGAEVGIPATQAIMNIALINGRPSMWGDLVIGLVRRSGLALYITETIEHDGEQMIATCTTKRKDTGEIITRTFSWADAVTAGLHKSNTYQKYGKRMLQMRARSWCLRDAYADVLKGMRIVEEERDFAGTTIEATAEPRPTPPAEAVKGKEVTSTKPAAEVIEPDSPDDLPKISPDDLANSIILDFDACETVDEIDTKMSMWEDEIKALPKNYKDLVAGKYAEIRERLDLPTT